MAILIIMKRVCIRIWVTLTLILLLTLSFTSVCVSSTSTARKIVIRNKSPSLITLYWISIPKEDYVRQQTSVTYPLDRLNINSFVNHTFAAVEITKDCVLPDGVTKPYDDSKLKSPIKNICTESRFTVTPNTDQIILVTGTGSKFLAVLDDDVSRLRSLLDEAFENCEEDGKECLRQNLEVTVGSLLKKNTLEKTVRESMAPLIEDYTCADSKISTSPPLQNTTWTHNGVTRDVSVLFKSDNAEVHIIKEFISPEECAAIEKRSAKSLHKATVASSDGGSEFSENRKALQASVKVPLDSPSDPVYLLSSRIYDYTNAHTNYNLTMEGQEDIMSIQYKGCGVNCEEKRDRYMPHCDGECGGDEYLSGSRVATVVIYCKVPEIGGGTNFAKSNIHIKPEAGMATWFRYVGDMTTLEDGTVTGASDSGYSEHSGCPVIEGEKKIVTQWMRAGVNAEEPWDSFNTKGLKKKDVEKFKEITGGWGGGEEL
ncbi:hypothetical protein TrST_g8633 [Triparma strigata]|uniref:Fe2OG dioxygenase domain-containing protein n=1 Tax=Triparma strigata TaxID=1606541 RepID=A0A9W7BZ71_9STRA|nr:hypothetical protein TrST_g8633 [Triparma strigata]